MPNKIKCEAGEPPMGEHSQHNFRVQFNNKTFTVSCNQHQTVLDAMKSLSAYKKKMSENEKKKAFSEDQIILQRGHTDKETAIATHFPCTLIEEGELVVLSITTEKVEEVKGDSRKVLPKEEYCVFYVETKGGKNAQTKAKHQRGLFSSSAIKKFTRLCVYGPKGITIKKALVSDGRFADMSVDFYLSDVNETNVWTESTQPINSLHCKTFRISFERGTQAKMAAQEIPKLRAISVKTVLEKEKKEKKEGSDPERIPKILRQKCSNLREIIEKQFPQNTFQKELDKVNFGKIQQTFSDIHRIRKLIELGESVCFVDVPVNAHKTIQGSAFVLLENYILTNAHLLTDCIEGDKTIKTNVEVKFNYENEIQQNNALQTFCLNVDNTIIDFDRALDYAVLKLQKDDTKPVPPGLLKCLSPKPEDAGACIIGHIGSAKKIDLTFIIEKERRQQSAEENLEPLKVDPGTYIAVVRRFIEKENLALIFASDDVITYDTFMYHGSSGSPVFDAEGGVFGLHTAGFVYDYPESQTHGVIEFARPLLDIVKKIVTNLNARADDEEARGLLVKIKKIAEHNPNLENILSECGI